MIRCKFSVYTLTAHWTSSTKSESALQDAAPVADRPRDTNSSLAIFAPIVQHITTWLSATHPKLLLTVHPKADCGSTSRERCSNSIISRSELDASEKQVLQEDVPCMTGWGTASKHKTSTNLAAPRVGQPSVTGGRAWGEKFMNCFRE